jgi:hypothetical protein
MFQLPRIFKQLPASTLKTPPPLILWQKKFCAWAAKNGVRGRKLFRSPPAVYPVALFTVLTLGKPRAAPMRH